jgi:protein-tyrosine phosphatase
MDADCIVDGIYIGGAPRSCGNFDVVVLAAKEYQDVPLNCRVIRAPLDDATPTKREVGMALRAAREVAHLQRQGKKVLVTCALGVNRSALIIALALIMNGMPVEQAVQLVRNRRRMPYGARVLSNQAFVRLLRCYGKENPAGQCPAGLRTRTHWGRH